MDSLPKERWEPFGEHFAVSSLGRVYNWKSERFLKVGNWSWDRTYLTVNIHENGKNRPRLLHRLIAVAFIPNPENFPQVNHKDGNRLNNSLDNLEWCTASENRAHSYRIGLRKSGKGERATNVRLSETEVRCILKQRKAGVRVVDLTAKYGSAVNGIVYNQTWKHIDRDSV